jgi:hypothetical protein
MFALCVRLIDWIQIAVGSPEKQAFAAVLRNQNARQSINACRGLLFHKSSSAAVFLFKLPACGTTTKQYPTNGDQPTFLETQDARDH